MRTPRQAANEPDRLAIQPILDVDPDGLI